MINARISNTIFLSGLFIWFSYPHKEPYGAPVQIGHLILINLALIATMMVLSDMRIAPSAGVIKIP